MIDKLAWVRLENGKILSTRSRGKGVYYTPGGKREAGESDMDTLVREVQEELSVALISDTVSYLETFLAQAHGQPEGTLVKMTCYTGDYQGDIRASSEIDEVVWLSYADRHRTGPVDQLIFDWLRERKLLM